MRGEPASPFVAGLWRRAWSPVREFALLAGQGPRLSPSVGRLLALRTPLAFLDLLLTCLALGRIRAAVLGMEGPVWRLALQWLPPGTSDLQELLQTLPPPPSLGRAWPWLLLIAPLSVLGIWLHDAVWDHGSLWMLGGLKERRGFGATLVADSEALQVGVFGALLALLGSAPWVGWLLSPVVVLAGAYFWVLRGFALAAFHRCPVWKGVAAAVLHAVLAACCALGILLGFLALLAWGLA